MSLDRAYLSINLFCSPQRGEIPAAHFDWLRNGRKVISEEQCIALWQKTFDDFTARTKVHFHLDHLVVMNDLLSASECHTKFCNLLHSIIRGDEFVFVCRLSRV